MSEGYSIQHVQVRPRTAGHAPEWVRFVGRELSHIPGDIEQPRGHDFTLYETPDEGRKLHVQEWVMEGGTQRRPGERATEFERIGGALYSEEQARQKYPEIFEALLKQAQE